MVERYQGSALYQYTRSIMGVPTRTVQYTVPISTSIVEIVGNNPRRMALMIINGSSTTSYLSIHPTYTPDEGIILTPGGGSITITAAEDGETVGYAIYGTSTVAGGNWVVMEVIAV